MFKDDQMISILTGAVLMVVIGTMVQRADGLSFLSPSEPVVAAIQDDTAEVWTNSLVRIDVMANDTGLDDDARDSLRLVGTPACGRVFVQDGALQYLPDERCLGEQTLRYGVTADGLALEGQVSVTVALKSRGQPARPRRAATPTPDPGAVVHAEPRPEASPAPATAAAPTPISVKPTQVAAVSPTPTTASSPAPATAASPAAPPSAVGRPAEPGIEIAAPDIAAPEIPAIVLQRVAEPASALRYDSGLSGGSGRLSWPSVWRDSHERLDIAVAVVERDEPDTRAPAPPVLNARASAPDLEVPGTDRTGPAIGRVPPTPGGGLRDVHRLAPEGLRFGPAERAIILPPVETQPTPALRTPQPDRAVEPAVQIPSPQRDPVRDPPGTEAAAAPPAAPAGGAPQNVVAAVTPCGTAPDMTLDVRRGAITVMSVSAPCHADTVAELTYGGMLFALTLDGIGRGALTTLGLAEQMPALLSFSNGDRIDFDLPFRGIDRISRIALAWRGAVDIGLHALEFGAPMKSAGHVHAGNPRSFSDARRARGGFLSRFRPQDGVGDNVQVYTFWHQRSAATGVVELMIDYAAQPDPVVADVCQGARIQPEITVRRTERGLAQRTIMRKLPELQCSTITRGNQDNHLISGAVEDLVVIPR